MSNQRAPHSTEAERSVVGQMLAGGTKVVGEVIGTGLRPDDFYLPVNQIVFDAVHTCYYEDYPIDPLSIGERCSKKLASLWSCDENDAIVRVRDMAGAQQFSGGVSDHAKVVKNHAQLRKLQGLASSIMQAVAAEEKPPDEIAGLISHNAMRIATDSLHTHEIDNFGDLGRRYIQQAKQLMQARQQGVELGAYFGLSFIDRYTRGLKPTELMFAAGEPGVGKTAIFWKAALNFAQRQMQKPEEARIGTLILSLEMAEEPSNMRLAQTLAHIDGGKLREGTMSGHDLQKITQEWGRRKELPLYFNFTSLMRAGAMRALIVEAIRRHNVGLVIIDHFRHFSMGQSYQNKTDEDEDKVIFLKHSLAKDLNLAVICLAHTTKGIENTPDKRPHMIHLRGSGAIAAEADFVNFTYRPYTYASDEDKISKNVQETDAEMIWRKNRYGLDGSEPFYFRPETMDIR